MADDRITAGRKARLVRGTLEEFFVAQENAIIDDLVIKYESGELTIENIWGRVGELALIRRTLNTLDSSINRGIVTEQKEFRDGHKSNVSTGTDG